MSDNYLGKRRTTAVKVNYDDRKGRGYGIVQPRFHKPRTQNNSYPYRDPDLHLDTEEQVDPDDLDAFVAKTNLGYHITDFMADRTKNPFYLAGGNRPLGEIATNSMVPFPDLYRGREVALGGSSPGNIHIGAPFPSRTLGKVQYGTKRGYSRSPRPMSIRGVDIPVYSSADIAHDDNDNILSLKMLIDDIHDEQDQEK